MRTILLLLIFCTTFIACQDDDNETISFEKGAKKRVKQITGENSVWGKYRLNFTYDKEGNFLKAWRLNAETGDTTGVITVDYDLNYHFLSIIDYVSQLDPARIPEYQQKYPNDWQDSVKSYHSEQLLCSVKLEVRQVTKVLNRPRRYLGSGKDYNATYVKVSQTKQMSEELNGQPTVVRCIDSKYGVGADNASVEERVVSKYEFVYTGGELSGGSQYWPDTYSETSWRKIGDISIELYSGVVVGIDSDTYRMRRSGKKVVVAEPGKTYTYELDDEWCAVRMENSDGDTATFEYEAGNGNFYELITTPEERALYKVWIR